MSVTGEQDVESPSCVVQNYWVK